MFKKITDERLVLAQLKHIKLAFMVQSLGILAILGYQAVSEGPRQMIANPLWLVFMLSAVVLGYAQLHISVDHEEPKTASLRPYSYKVLGCLMLGVLVFVLYLALSNDQPWTEGLLLGAVATICTLAPVTIVHRLRSARRREEEE
ncbi:branched-chain amino acid ABC transporter substrate-binding protein [Paenibacillus sp. FSL K6-1230]|uniref:branched-chain amino acid ABC transporter substrate-binding protein n=1 Tax=Paenibacillus sp. FSL K6-1230 TaxID=2921603 RepID=UPI0003AADB89